MVLSTPGKNAMSTWFPLIDNQVSVLECVLSHCVQLACWQRYVSESISDFPVESIAGMSQGKTLLKC